MINSFYSFVTPVKNQENENAIVFHGKFIGKDKQIVFDKVFNSFKS